MAIPDVVARLTANVQDFIDGWDRAADAALRAAARIRAAAAAANGADLEGPRSDRYRELDGELRRLTETLRRASDGIRDLGNASRRGGDDMDEFGRRVREAGDGLGQFGRGGSSALGLLARFPQLLVIIVPLLAMLGAAVLAGGAALLGLAAAAGVAALGGKGLSDAFSRLGDTTQGLRRHLDSVFRSGLSGEMAKLGQAVSTLEPEFKQIAQAIVDVVKETTQWLRSAEGLQKMRQFLGGVRDLITALAPGVKAVVQTFVEFGAAAAPAMKAIGAALSDVLIGLRDVFREAQKSGDLEKAFRLGAMVIKAFGAAIAGTLRFFIWLAARIYEVSVVMLVLSAAASEGAGALRRLGGSAQQGGQRFGALGAIVQAVTQKAGQGIRDMVSKAQQALQQGGQRIVQAWTETWQKVQAAGRAADQQIVQGVLGMVGRVLGNLRQFSTQSTQAWVTMWAEAARATQEGADKLVAFYADLPGKALAALDGWTAQMRQAGQDAVNGLVEGAKAAAAKLIEVLTQMARKAIAAVKQAFGVRSPSTIFRDEVGAMIPAGIADGITGNAGLIRDAMRRLPGPRELTMAGRVQLGGFGVDGLSARAAAVAAGAGGQPAVHVHLSPKLETSGGTDQLFTAAIAAAARSGKLKITANAVVGARHPVGQRPR